MRRHRPASSRSSPAAGSRCHVRVDDDVLRDEAAEMEKRGLLGLLVLLMMHASITGCCCWGSGGGEEQGVIASSSSLKEALAVMERRPLLGSCCESAIV